MGNGRVGSGSVSSARTPCGVRGSRASSQPSWRQYRRQSSSPACAPPRKRRRFSSQPSPSGRPQPSSSMVRRMSCPVCRRHTWMFPPGAAARRAFESRWKQICSAISRSPQTRHCSSSPQSTVSFVLLWASISPRSPSSCASRRHRSTGRFCTGSSGAESSINSRNVRSSRAASCSMSSSAWAVRASFSGCKCICKYSRFCSSRRSECRNAVSNCFCGNPASSCLHISTVPPYRCSRTMIPRRSTVCCSE